MSAITRTEKMCAVAFRTIGELFEPAVHYRVIAAVYNKPDSVLLIGMA